MFAEVTALLGNSKIKKEWGGKYDTAAVLLFLLLSDDAVLMHINIHLWRSGKCMCLQK